MNPTQTMVKIVLDRWYASIKSFDTILNALTDEQLQMEISPGKNRGIYILGHLIAVHDSMLPLLDFGDKIYPELSKIFILSPDKSIPEIPSADELRSSWTNLNEVLNHKIESLSDDQWFEKHTSVSAEDFINEPHRNKLNIMVTRTTHLAYHTGQLVLLKENKLA